MIKAVIFYWGGVLIKFPPDQTVQYWAKYLDINPHRLKLFYEQKKKELWKGTLSQKKFFELVDQKFHCHKPRRKRLFEDSFDEAYLEQNEVFNIAHQIRKKGYRLALISNSEIAANKYFRRKKYSIFEHIIISINENIIKTEERFYHLTLKRLHLQPEEVLFIDDKQYCIKVAKAVGMNVILFKNAAQLKRTLKKYDILGM